MSIFIYEILKPDGKIQKGKIEKENIYDAASSLKKDGVFILSLKDTQKITANHEELSKKISFSSLEKIIFTDHLAAMIKSGTPLTEALTAYKEKDDNKKTDVVINGLISSVEQGIDLSKGLEKYPHIFSPLYRSLIKASEMAGNLDEILDYLANFLRREYEFSQRVKSALMYPVFVLIIAFFVICFLVIAVIPRMTELTKSFGGDLPTFTRIVSNASIFISQFGPVLIIGFIILIFGLFSLLKNNKTRKKIDPLLLKIPLIGPLLRKYILARFLRTVGNCFKNGIPLASAFKVVGEVMDNSIYKASCFNIEQRITKGESLTDALNKEGKILYPKIIVRMIKGAEKTGTVDDAMIRLSVFYENEVDRDLKKVTTLIEPALIIFLGLIVAAIAVSVIAPIYQLTSKIK